jgi:signal transduction histidine kinase
LLRQVALPGFVIVFLVVLLAGLTLGASIGRVLSGRVEAINATARAVTEGDLARRVPLDGSGDEFDELGLHFNAMLAKTERLIERMRRVGDDVAHDLRRPLSRVRSGLEVSLLEARSPEQYQAAIALAVGELETVIATFNALLQISRVEGEAPPSDWPLVDLSQEALELAELYEPYVTEVRVEAGTLVRGDRPLIRQALSNLIENALKYSPSEAEIVLTVLASANHAEVAVADRGPGIAAEHRQHVLERFARLEEARSTAGNGLGLTLVKAVADRHGAELHLEDNGPGLRARLVFKRGQGSPV